MRQNQLKIAAHKLCAAIFADKSIGSKQDKACDRKSEAKKNCGVGKCIQHGVKLYVIGHVAPRVFKPLLIAYAVDAHAKTAEKEQGYQKHEDKDKEK